MDKVVLNALYASLLERAQGITGLRHADIDWGQMQGSDEPPFPLPALFFNIEQIDWKELGGGTQEGTLRLYADLYEGYQGKTFRKWQTRKTTNTKGKNLLHYRTDRVGRRGRLTQLGRRDKGRGLLVGHNSGQQRP